MEGHEADGMIAATLAGCWDRDLSARIEAAGQPHGQVARAHGALVAD